MIGWSQELLEQLHKLVYRSNGSILRRLSIIMKRRLYSLLLLSVFICSILTACGGSGGAASGPSGSYPSGASKKDQITTSLGWLHAGLTTVQGRYCTAIYADTCIPTRTSDFSGQNVSYKNGNLVGIAIRQYRNMVTTGIIVY